MEDSVADPRPPARPANRYFLSLRESPSPLDFFSLAALALRLWSSMAYSTGVCGEGGTHQPRGFEHAHQSLMAVPEMPAFSSPASGPANLPPALRGVLRRLVKFPLLHGAVGREVAAGLASLQPNSSTHNFPSPLVGILDKGSAPYLSLLCRAACLRSQQYRIR